MVDFGLLDFAEFGVFLERYGKMVDSLFVTAINAVGFPNVVVGNDKSELWFAVDEYHKFGDGLDVHADFKEFLWGEGLVVDLWLVAGGLELEVVGYVL